MQVTSPDIYDETFAANQPVSQMPLTFFRESQNLIKYQKKKKVENTVNLMDSTFGDLPPPKEVDDPNEKAEEKLYYPHWKGSLDLNLIYNVEGYSRANPQIPAELAELLRVDFSSYTYHPPMYLSDFWCLQKNMRVMNDTLDGNSLNLTLKFQTYMPYYMLFQKNFEKQYAQQREMGIQAMDLDELKRMWIETDPILLGVTTVVSLLHSVFEVLAFRNDIAFWNGKENMEGISIKSLYFQVVQHIIIFLYLLDNETSWMIVVSTGFSILLEFWKIKTASKVVKLEKFPYYWLEDNEQYVESETKEYDDIAYTYMSYAAVPMLGGYAVYSVMYQSHKSWYSFVINTLVGCIYTFGFINMTPQLYINYRLQSVEHMPQRAMIYRFLNTIIDDLFSFIITMPTMHRISCFRDDVIFVIYLYQRWIYAVDKSRGMYATERKPSTVKEEVKEESKADAPAIEAKKDEDK